MDNNFEIGGRKFKLSKVNAFKQFHIVRRVGPILAELMPAMKELSKFQNANLSESEKLEGLAKVVSPIMNGLSKLSDTDADYVLMGLLEAVEMQQQQGNWAKVVAGGSMLMIQDLELPLLLQVAGRAFMFNLSGFFAGLPQQ